MINSSWIYTFQISRMTKSWKSGRNRQKVLGKTAKINKISLEKWKLVLLIS